ncbi:hypothetical protein HAX54_048633, partial [Datura stramonium]|nr:hypothetical protein [Datura stramonium]
MEIKGQGELKKHPMRMQACHHNHQGIRDSVGPQSKKGLDTIKTKEPEGIHGTMLSISERSPHIDNVLSHLYGMKMLQLRICGVTEKQLQQLNMEYPLSEHSRALHKVGPSFEEPFDYDDATDKEHARVDSDLESDDEGDDFEMGGSYLFAHI